jgi:hypothetical protein
MSEFLNGLGDRLNAHPPGHNLPLADGGGLLDEGYDLFGYGAGTACQHVVNNGHLLIIAWRFARRVVWVAQGCSLVSNDHRALTT